MQSWEETIQYIRTQPEFNELVEKAYFDEDLVLNVERFRESIEFKETLSLINRHIPGAKSILDVGSGNGISALAFALEGFDVVVCEPDPSETVGAGAIEKLRLHYDLTNLGVYRDFAENLDIPGQEFDIVYVRQAMHHAHDLTRFIFNITSMLRPKGFLLTVRDHVIFNEADKERFLEEHPLHKFYGGENAFTAKEYRNAMSDAGLKIISELKYYDSPINYFPTTDAEIDTIRNTKLAALKKSFQSKIGYLALLPILFRIYKWKNKQALELDEMQISGRMYSYIAQKL